MFQITLKDLREKRGLSQRDLAKLLGVSSSTIGMWESGKREPNFETLLKIAGFFDVTTDYMMGREPENKPVLTEKDEHDIKNKIEDLLNMMSHEKGLMFDGDPMTPEALESIKNAMMLGMTAATLKNKEKYNPNKHKKAATDGRNGAGEKTDKKV